jgi:3-dehydroquinate synthetase
MRELCNGMGEAIKTGAIRSKELFELCEGSAAKVPPAFHHV